MTGGNRGIGLEVCRQLAALGHHTLLASRSRSKGESAANSLGAHAGIITIVELDVSDPRSVDRAAERVGNDFGGIDILVNNAAILLGEHDDLLDAPHADLVATFTTNVFGAIGVAQAFVPGMLERGYGRVVNVSSTAGQLSTMETYAPLYSMSKTALNALTRQLAAATKGHDVLVNSACPGWVRTDMGGPGAPRSVEQGADTLVWLATLPRGGPSGKFFRNRRPIDW